MKKTIAFLVFLIIASCGMSQNLTVQPPFEKETQLFVELFAVRRNSQSNQMLQRSYVYFPLVEEGLKRHQLPEELKYLPMVESTLNTSAKDRSGRMGLWQLSPQVAAQCGLDVTDDVNDCFDPELATEAACSRLQELYSLYGDWFLVIAAYNTSPATVDQAIAKANGYRDYWAIHRFLPRETQGFVPAFLALGYVMSRPEEYGLYPMCSVDIWRDAETVTVTDDLSFEQVCTVTGISMEELCQLNPKYLHKRIPASASMGQTIRLPPRYAILFKQTFLSN